VRRWAVVLVLLLSMGMPPGSASSQPVLEHPAVPPEARAATLPLRAVFYYPWFPQTWHDDDQFHPTAGAYSSSNATLVERHIKQMKYAGIQAAIASWWGQGLQHEGFRIPLLLKKARAKNFFVAPYYEPEGQSSDPSQAKIEDDLAYLMAYRDRFPESFLQVDGKPVIFVYNAANPSCADVTKWSRATNGFSTWYVSLKVFSGFADCANQPSTWHQYGPASPYSTHGRYYANASPGFFKHGDSTPTLARNLDRFCYDLSRVATSRTKWRLVTSFNEWGEGTAVEPAREWSTPNGFGKYLNLMHRVFLKGKRCGPP
jgi:hypothetical protein